jgi:2-methylisocitrate lyase-like PEP mutase family enzyme
MAGLAAAGAQRVSMGGALTWTAVEAFASAARAIHERGDFSGLASAPALDDWFA